MNSNFYNKVNQEMQNIAEFNSILHDGLEAVPSLKFIASQKINPLDLNFSRLTTDSQEKYLESQTNFKDWKAAQLSCNPEAFKNQMIRLSRRLKLQSEKPEIDVLTHFFLKTYVKSTVSEEIITLSKIELQLEKNFLQKATDKITNVFYEYLMQDTNRQFFAQGLIVGVAAFVASFVGTIIIAGTLQVALTIILTLTLERAAFVLIGATGLLLAERITYLTMPTIHKSTLDPVIKTVATIILPWRLFTATEGWLKSKYWALMNQRYDYNQALNLWINTFLKERALKHTPTTQKIENM